jgi:hypothetical protein
MIARMLSLTWVKRTPAFVARRGMCGTPTAARCSGARAGVKFAAPAIGGEAAAA